MLRFLRRTADTEDEGFLKLFDPRGIEAQADRRDLLSIERMSFNKRVHRRAAGNHSGRYWLISNRPGKQPMLLSVSIFHCYPRTRNEWRISYCTNGVASYPHFDVEAAIESFSRAEPTLDPNDGLPIPFSVAELAREHVAYRAGKTPGPDPLERFGIPVREEADLRLLLAAFTFMEPADPSELMMYAGKTVGILELVLAAEAFCHKNGREKRVDQLLELLVPREHHVRLKSLKKELARQLADG
jgi:hypothetical protein